MSGCSGGGKSTLLDELAERGFATVPEPGRRIVERALAGGGGTLPWVDLAGFAREAMALARADRASAHGAGCVFFDRSLIDAAAALEHATGEHALDSIGREDRYHGEVFMLPPSPEIYAADSARRHSLDDAMGEYRRLLVAYGRLGYRIVVVPKASIAERADFILQHLASSGCAVASPHQAR
ncbi:AAA family ATPase [Sphingomonas sp. QA11]|uniref:AAA family ATPase n=1 Tax=Sphingomonas sp. QA11 TaxID=2950605 RepID=UPI00234A2E77|nr:AAA family ATPase [Sphingomonas sp. QA11]WCM29920.1 AAA family ATPase [Sphingomonas sp. QA11]